MRPALTIGTVSGGKERRKGQRRIRDIGRCAENCAYCNDPYFGHPKPHNTVLTRRTNKERRKA